MSEIMNCPFCNGRAIMRERFINGVANVKHYRLECVDCHASFLNWNKNTSKAAAAWNRRAQPENEPDATDINVGNKPLTLEELRQMDGEAVYLVIEDINGFEPLTMCALVEVADGGIWLTNNLGGRSFYEDALDDGITAYRTKPERSDGE